MRTTLFLLLALFALNACRSNPYENVPVKEKKILPETKPIPVFEVEGDEKLEGIEGTEIIQKFHVVDNINPKGPFRVYLENFPDGSELRFTSDADFEIHFVPSSVFVKGQAKRLATAKLHVINPDSQTIEKGIEWNINNKPQGPYVVGPRSVTVTALSQLNATFLAEDLNGEEFSHLKILKPTDMVGLVLEETLLDTDAKNIFPSTLAQLRWSNVPADLVGQSVTITVQACSQSYRLCQTHDLLVNIVAGN